MHARACVALLSAALVALRAGDAWRRASGAATTAAEAARGAELRGVVVLVTGANEPRGLGYETARALAAGGAHVVVAARTREKARAAVAALRDAAGAGAGALTPLQCDLSSLLSVAQAARDFAATGLPLHVLVNNAGVLGAPERQVTADGIEMQMGVNHVGHFHLTSLLLPTLLRSATPTRPSRVVCVSSVAHGIADEAFTTSAGLESAPYTPLGAYGNSKMANVMHCRELHHRYHEKGLLAFSVHPGAIMTNIARSASMLSILKEGVGLAQLYRPVLRVVGDFKSVAEGAGTQVYAAVRAPVSTSGGYLADCRVQEHWGAALVDSRHRRAELWNTTERLIANAVAGTCR